MYIFTYMYEEQYIKKLCVPRRLGKNTAQPCRCPRDGRLSAAIMCAQFRAPPETPWTIAADK